MYLPIISKIFSILLFLICQFIIFISNFRISLVHKRRRTSSSSERNKKKSKQEDEEDQETLKEKQALVDLLSDDDIIPLSSKVEDNDTQNKVEKNKTASNK